MLQIAEIFRSIQGESTYAGTPCSFVRLAGCNLNCVYCDSRYAGTPTATRSVEEVADHILSRGDRLVEITGGEPLLQPDALPLAERLSRAGRTVLLETNGSVLMPRERPFIAIVDWKTPGSGHPHSFNRENLSRLRPRDEVKFVICDRDDFDWAVTRLDQLAGRTVLFSAAGPRLSSRLLAEWILEAGIGVRLQLQLHRILWPNKDRGA